MVGSEETVLSWERDLGVVIGNFLYTSALVQCTDILKQLNRTVGISRKGALKKYKDRRREKNYVTLNHGRHTLKALRAGLAF